MSGWKPRCNLSSGLSSDETVRPGTVALLEAAIDRETAGKLYLVVYSLGKNIKRATAPMQHKDAREVAEKLEALAYRAEIVEQEAGKYP